MNGGCGFLASASARNGFAEKKESNPPADSLINYFVGNAAITQKSLICLSAWIKARKGNETMPSFISAAFLSFFPSNCFLSLHSLSLISFQFNLRGLNERNKKRREREWRVRKSYYVLAAWRLSLFALLVEFPFWREKFKQTSKQQTESRLPRLISNPALVQFFFLLAAN